MKNKMTNPINTAQKRQEKIDYIETIIRKHEKEIKKLIDMQNKVKEGKDIL